MTYKLDFKHLILSSLLTFTPIFATAGSGDTGGAQGAVITNGKLYFSDTHTQKELSEPTAGGGDAVGTQGAVTTNEKLYFSDIHTQKELSKATAGGGDAGGAQGAVTTNGKLYFLDILTKKELSELKFIPSAQADIISDIKCSDEEYRSLREYNYTTTRVNGLSGHKRGNTILTAEFAEARRLLKKASESLLLPFSNCEFVRMPNLDDLMVNMETQRSTISFYGTAFEIPQLKDATQILPLYQNQIAYFNRGIVYFQTQALQRLHENQIHGKNQIHGVFIKETLRYVNLRYMLGLSNKDLEMATFFIYHEHFEKFNNSEYANKLRIKFPAKQCPQRQDLYEDYNAGNSYGINFHPQFLNHIEKSAPGLYLNEPSWHEFDYNPEKIWSTKTGKIIDRKNCEGRILSREE